ncbi:MAG: M20/M25/M40 family metallo-hydrolase [Planctomycetes bacterium]|nr:M20/M25/M40 family metallo-hydrolase [Planctomycetota bacterium]
MSDPRAASHRPSREELSERLLELIRCETTTGSEDRGLGPLRAYLEELGAEVEEQRIAPGRTNLIASFGDPSRARVLYSTHLDTVPPYIGGRREGTRVYGRGACDAKGQIVAQLEALRRLLAAGQGDVAWLGVIGEETDSIGAQRATELAPRFPSLALVIDGEPTSNRLATGQRGVMTLVLECAGRAAHSGVPEKGLSAVHELVDWLARLRAQSFARDPELGPEVFNIGRIAGGEALNVLAEKARAELLVRSLPDSQFLERVAALAPACGSVRRVHETPSARFPAIEGFERVFVPFGSDAPRLRALAQGGAVALVGPGTIDVAHTEHEHLELAELEEGIAMLEALGTRVLGGTEKIE